MVASKLSWQVQTFAKSLDAAAGVFRYRIQVERE